MKIKENIGSFYNWAFDNSQSSGWVAFWVATGSFFIGLASIVLLLWLIFEVLPGQFTLGFIVVLIGLRYYTIIQQYRNRKTAPSKRRKASSLNIMAEDNY